MVAKAAANALTDIHLGQLDIGRAFPGLWLTDSSTNCGSWSARTIRMQENGFTCRLILAHGRL